MTPDGLFFPSCATCASWNGDMCELISNFCDDGAEWQPSEAFLEAYPQVRAMVARDAMLCGLLRDASDKNRRLRISQLRRMDFVVNDGGRNGFFERCLRFACDVRQKDAARNQDIVPRIMRFNKARRKFSLSCLAEIERLRGEG